MLSYMANASPEDAYLGVPTSLQGLKLSYDHHACHPRNGDRWRGGGEQAARTWASMQILIETSEEFVFQLPCRNITPFLHTAVSLLNAMSPSHI